MRNTSAIPLERTQFSFQAPPKGLQKRKYQRYPKIHSTYLGLIACVIQKSPNKRLTFCQIMDNLQPFISGERRGLENNIRVCLSSNDCFVKVPMHDEYPGSRKNFWKVDETRITAKMLRRHFKGMLETFPDLASRLKREPDTSREGDTIHNAQKSRASSTQKETEKKFCGPFSIDSILKKDVRPRSCARSSMLHSIPSDLERHSRDFEYARIGMGMKRKRDREEHVCGPAEKRNEFGGYAYVDANAAFSNCGPSAFSTQKEIQSLPDYHQAFRPMTKLRMCPELPDTMFPRQVAASQFHRSKAFARSHGFHPLNVYHLSHSNFGL